MKGMVLSMHTIVSVDLPLPLDIPASLMQVLGTLYPNTQIVTDGDPRKLTFAIADTDRYAFDEEDGDCFGEDSDEAPDEAVAGATNRSDTDPSRRTALAQIRRVPADPEIEATLTSVRNGAFGIQPPEWFAKLIIGGLLAVLDTTSAENYLEMTLPGPDGVQYAVVACRTADRTPHQLRQAAEARADRYAAKLRELGVDPDMY
jgi:hypothetical protein